MTVISIFQRRNVWRSAAFALFFGLLSPAAFAASCGESATGFDSWLENFKAEAASQGISRSTLASALTDVSYDRKVIGLDRGQRSFKLSFEAFYARRVSNGLIAKGRNLMQTYGSTLSRIEQRFGVPAPVILRA